MKLINQNAEFIKQEPGIEGIYKIVELAGRTSYLSWDKITDDSAKKFVDMLIKSKHTSCLEHGTVYLKLPAVTEDKFMPTVKEWWPIVHSPYSKSNDVSLSNDPNDLGNIDKMFIAITTNLRVLLENNMPIEHISKYLCEPTEFHEKRLSVKVITDIGVTREFNRHRTFSIVEQSTRYCNFSKDKFGNEITFITPSWWKADLNKTYLEPEVLSWHIDEESLEHKARYVWFIESCTDIERHYLLMIRDGMQPQEARAILPLCTKTEVVYTAFESDWRHFFDLRLRETTGAAHPQAKALAQLIYNEFEKYGLTRNMG